MKKKPSFSWGYLEIPKIDLKMKLTFILFFIFLLKINANSYSQNTKISLDLDDVTIAHVFSEIKKITEFKILFANSEIDLERKITINVKKKRIEKILDLLFSKTAIRYKIIDKQIVLAKDDINKGIIQEHFNNNLKAKVPKLQQIEIRGTVKDGKGVPLPGANVLIEGTSTGTQTDFDGNYSIDANKETVLVFSYLGMKTAKITVGDSVTINVVLQEDTAALDEIVVTALGITKAQKKVGYSIQKIDGESLTLGREANVASKLAGNVAGLQINSSSSIGGSTRITLRGETSLSEGGNTPLFVVDGVPIDNSFSTNSTVDWGSAIADINPDDIESMNVLKGPVAAALYGSRAGNGAIIIVTKKGTSKKGISVNVNSSIIFDEILKYPDTYQYKYGAGLHGDRLAFNRNDFSFNQSVYDETWANIPYDPNLLVEWWWSETSNGTRAGAVDLVRGVSVKHPYVSNGKNNYKQFFETGVTLTNNVSISSGGDKSNFRASYTNLDQEGIIPGTNLKRHNFSLNAGGEILSKLTASINVNIVNVGSDNRPKLDRGTDGIGYALAWMAPGTHIDKLEEYWQRGLEGSSQIRWRDNINNPYFIGNEIRHELSKDRLYGNASLNYAFTDRLNLTVRYGMDLSTELNTSRRPFGIVNFQTRYQENNIKKRETNADFLLTYNTSFKDNKWGLNASLGGNLLHIDNSNLFGNANNLLIPNIYTINNAATQDISLFPGISQKKVNSIYGVASLAYNDAIFLDLTARNDWSSTLPETNRSYFYPSASLSFLLPELVELPKEISFLKFRLAYAQVGKDTSPYQGSTVFNGAGSYGATNTYSLSGSIANQNLLPEETSSYEFGVDAKFFNNRLGVDFTYYYIDNKNQVLNATLPNSSGFNSRTINAGKIENKGIELVLKGTPLRTDDFSWNVIANFSKNENKVIELAEGLTQFGLGSYGDGDQFIIAEVGRPIFGVFGFKQATVEDENSPHFGRQIFDSNGVLVRNNTPQYLGNASPDWMLGLTNTFKYKNFTLSTLIDIRHGGVLHSGVTDVLYRGGYNQETLQWREEGILGDGVVAQSDGSYIENTTRVIGEDIKRLWSSPYELTSANQVYDASFVKLRELSLSYSFPKSFLSKTAFQSINIALVGRNLLLFSNVPNQDPDVYFEGVPGNSGRYYIPTTRSYGFNINIGL
ncbi:SusC/RagA family TonB-linked outer membrane protein [Flavivirga spongiicola]|uniref:SusC/RagA family TonB-linked outer membrane protein n=1 Tax=Flavivirga spongiicola TaxID=421621 RepID=A0ABU7XRA6_9FLAO|nr:SusC/RagA family TonB-linked outer membrane protein [Flavivirga sp. MEBiC05379]MDO5977357.1 SusC/RagA family TonB-linked outer membrane protein [Flavivirga sp. MEBiC05379]